MCMYVHLTLRSQNTLFCTINVIEFSAGIVALYFILVIPHFILIELMKCYIFTSVWAKWFSLIKSSCLSIYALQNKPI